MGSAGTSTPISTLNSTCKMKRTSKSSSSLSDKSSVELGFESDHPAGGTIKKRPATNFSMSESMYSNYKDYSEIGGADPLSAAAAAAANSRRSNSSERLNSGRNYDELQQLLDELHTNVKQAKDIQVKNDYYKNENTFLNS